jgi:hypothetical protein
MPPPDQGLHRIDAAAGELPLWLTLEKELVPFHGAAQIGFQHEPAPSRKAQMARSFRL